MKYILLPFLSLIVSICLSQQIDYTHFDTYLMNKAMLKEFNEYRRNLGLDTLVYSDELFKTISKPNCVEVSNSGNFYHPYINDIWSNTDIKYPGAFINDVMMNLQIVVTSFFKTSRFFRRVQRTPSSIND
jgi:hypothetical protein